MSAERNVVTARPGAVQPAHGRARGAVPRAPADRLHIGLVILQAIGHITLTQNLQRVLVDRGDVDVRWVKTSLYRRGGLPERLPGLPASVRSSVRGLLEVRHLLNRWPCDVLLFNPQNPALFCQWYLLRVPSILMTDATPCQYDRLGALYEHAADANPAVRALKHQVNVLNFRLARALVPWSTWTRDSMIRDYGVDPRRAHVIPPGVDTRWWRPTNRRPAGGRVGLLFVGGDFERKGGRLLLDVFTKLCLHERAELHIVTRSTLLPAPGVVVHQDISPNSPELRQLYHQADVFVLPTLADCFPIASIEAMAAGLPVISTAVGGIPDMIQSERTGYLLPPGDGRGLGEALVRLIDDVQHRHALGAAAREASVTRFDAHTNVLRILALARSISAERPRRAFPRRAVPAARSSS